MLSVVIPVHGRPALLQRTLQALWLQPHRPFEVIVCIDASVEDIDSVCKEWTERLELGRIHVAGPQSAGVGAGAARNAGIRLARGERILFLDGDCLVPAGVLAAHAALGVQDLALFGFRRHLAADTQAELGDAQSNLAALAYRREMRDTDNIRKALASRIARDDPLICKLAYTCHISYPTRILKRIGGFWEEMRGSGAEDDELALRAFRAGCRFRFLDLPVYHQDHPRCPLQRDNIERNRQLFLETWRDERCYRHGEPIA